MATTTKQVFLICKLGLHKVMEEGRIKEYGNLMLQNSDKQDEITWGFKDCREFTDYKMAEDKIKELPAGQYRIEKLFINEGDPDEQP